MKNLKQLVLLCFFGGLTFSMSAAPVSAPAPATVTPISAEESVMDAEELLASLDRDVMEEKLGRKLRLGERIVLKMMKKKLKKKIKKGKATNGALGLVSLILSSVGFLFLILGFFIGGLFFGGLVLCLVGFVLGIIGRKNDGDALSTAGFAIGLTGFILGILLLLIGILWLTVGII